MFVFFDNRTDYVLEEALLEKIEEMMTKTLFHENIYFECEISYSFVTPEEIKSLNKTYRKIDKATDVLSFPMIDDFEGLKNREQINPLLLGDVVISIQQAQIQADEYGQDLSREICYLTVHSILHLLGYDHMEENEKKKMREVEKEIMSEY
ncbi:MAG: rRNA maturation RNase YbeY [Eubacteriaceae bacterium]